MPPSQIMKRTTVKNKKKRSCYEYDRTASNFNTWRNASLSRVDWSDALACWNLQGQKKTWARASPNFLREWRETTWKKNRVKSISVEPSRSSKSLNSHFTQRGSMSLQVDSYVRCATRSSRNSHKMLWARSLNVLPLGGAMEQPRYLNLRSSLVLPSAQDKQSPAVIKTHKEINRQQNRKHGFLSWHYGATGVHEAELKRLKYHKKNKTVGPLSETMIKPWTPKAPKAKCTLHTTFSSLQDGAGGIAAADALANYAHPHTHACSP